MAVANTAPIFSLTGMVQRSSITNAITALATSNGTAATGVTTTTGEMVVVATGDVTNGSYLQRLRLRWTGSTSTSAASAPVVRIYVSTVNSGATTSSNTYCIEEIVMGTQTAASATAATFPYDVPLNFILPAGSYLLASVSAKPTANTEIAMTVYGGNY
jgi:hypothetical protein